MEPESGPEDDGGGQRERDPLPARELGRRDHRHHDKRDAERDRQDKPPAQRIGGVDGMLMGARERGRVARVLDGLDQVRN